MKTNFRMGVLVGPVLAFSICACSTGDNGGGGEEPVYRSFVYVANFGSISDSVLGSISAFAMNASTGALTAVTGSPFAVGGIFTSIAFDPARKYAYVAAASNGVLDGPGDVSGFAVNKVTGALTAVPGSPFTAGQGTFSVAVDPTGHYLYATNFDSNDITAYAINAATGALSAVAGSPFADGGPGRELPGPTGLAVLPSGKFACVAHYYAYDISVLAIDAATGTLADIAGSPFATEYGSYGLTVDPTGRFVYVADYGNDSVSAYAIDATTGVLTTVAGSPFATGAVGSLAWSVAVDPAGKFVYVVNRSADSVSGYTINSATGALTAIPGSPFPVGPDPHAVAVDPTSKFAYVANFGSNSVTAFAINSSTGALTPIAGSPFAAGPGPANIAIVRIRQ